MKALQTLKVPTSYLNQSQVQFSQLARAIVDLKNQGIVPVLCIDEFEGFSRQEFGKKFVEGLRAMAQDEGLVLITASKRPLAEVIMDMIGETSPLFNIIRKITLEPFTESEAQEFVQDKSGQAGFSDQERASFLKHATLYGPSGTQQWPPLRLQLVGQMLLDDKQIAWRTGKSYQVNDVRHQVDFEKRLTEEYQSVMKQ